MMNRTRHLIANRVGRWPGLLLVGLLLVVMGGCSSPTEEANGYYEKGMELLDKGDLVKSRVEFRNALQIKPDMADAWYGLSLVEEKRGQWPKVFGLLKKVVDINPEHAEAQIRLGKLLLAAGQIDKALAQSNTSLKLAPKSADALALRAAVLFKLDDPKGAVEQANAALQAAPDNIDALIVLASERLAAGDPEKAIAFMDRGLQSHEKNVALQLVKLQAFEKTGDTQQTEGVLKRLIELYPEKNGFRHALAKFYLREGRTDDAEAIYRGIADKKPGDWQARLDVVRFLNAAKGSEAAEAELKQYIAKTPDAYPPRFTLAELYITGGEKAAGIKVLQDIVAKAGTAEDGLKARARLATLNLADNRDEAMKLIEEILAVDPRHPDALILKASVNIDRRALDEAIAELRTVLRDTPDSARALLLLAMAHQSQGAEELAEDYYARAFEAGKAASAIGMPYVRFLLKKGQVDRAGLVLDDILGREPNSLAALKAQAQVKLLQADWVAAEEIAERIRKLADDKENSSEIMGAAYAGQKKYDDSIEAFRKAQQASPTAVRPMVSLVRAYVRAGRQAEALTFLKAVLEANPENAVARVLEAQLFMLEDHPEDAIRVLAELVRVKPDDPLGYRNLAAVYARTEKIPEAQAVLEKGLARLPGDFSLLLTRAGVSELAGNYEASIADYESLYKQRPNSDIVANNLASMLAEHRNDPESLKRALKLAQRFRKSQVPHFRDTLGWAYYRNGDARGSVGLLEDAVKQEPNLPVFRYHLGMSYLAEQDKSAAKRELEAALELAAKRPFGYEEQVHKALNAL